METAALVQKGLAPDAATHAAYQGLHIGKAHAVTGLILLADPLKDVKDLFKIAFGDPAAIVADLEAGLIGCAFRADLD